MTVTNFENKTFFLIIIVSFMFFTPHFMYTSIAFLSLSLSFSFSLQFVVSYHSSKTLNCLFVWRFSYQKGFHSVKRGVCVYVYLLWSFQMKHDTFSLLNFEKLLTLDLYSHIYFCRQFCNMMIVKLFRGKMLFI